MLLVFISLLVLTVRDGEDVLVALAFAVVLSVATMALGSRKLAEKKAIVTRLSSIEEVAGMDMLCSDKTGTLTMNKMVLQDELPVFTPGIDRDHVLPASALAAKWREPPKDALDTLVLNAVDLDKCDNFQQIEYMPFDPRKKRTEATLRDMRDDPEAGGQYFKVTKGAPHVVLGMTHNKSEIGDED